MITKWITLWFFKGFEFGRLDELEWINLSQEGKQLAAIFQEWFPNLAPFDTIEVSTKHKEN